MKQYKVTYKGFVYVEANSKEEALRLAQDGAGWRRCWRDEILGRRRGAGGFLL